MIHNLVGIVWYEPNYRRPGEEPGNEELLCDQEPADI